MTSWELYWLTRLDNINDAIGIIFCISLLGSVIIGISWGFAESDESDNLPMIKKHAKRIFLVFALSNLGWFIPTTKEMAAIIILPNLSKAAQSNEKLVSLPDKVLDLANAWIDELGPKKGNASK